MTKTLPNYAGLRQFTRARSTGTHVGVYDGYEADLDTEPGRWSTVCEEHSNIIAHETLALARSFASCPEEWCDECAEAIYGPIRNPGGVEA